MSNPELTQVLAAVITRNDAWLLCLRPPEKRHGGCWEFPGGKLEAGETLADAARRELREELGVEVTAVGAVIHAVRDERSPYVINFVDVTIGGEPQALEHSALCWVRPDAALSLALAPADRAFVEHALGT